jgi:hypothetical protein
MVRGSAADLGGLGRPRRPRCGLSARRTGDRRTPGGRRRLIISRSSNLLRTCYVPPISLYKNVRWSTNDLVCKPTIQWSTRRRHLRQTGNIFHRAPTVKRPITSLTENHLGRGFSFDGITAIRSPAGRSCNRSRTAVKSAKGCGVSARIGNRLGIHSSGTYRPRPLGF